MKLIEDGDLVIGVDWGEQEHHLCVLDDRGEKKAAMVCTNEEEAVEAALLKVASKGKIHVISEGNRGGASILVLVAVALGITVWTINSKALNRYRECEGQPRKDDVTDAYLLGRMLVNGMNACHKAVSPTDAERELCRLTRLRGQLRGDRVRSLQRVRSRLVELCPEVLRKSWAGPVWKSAGMLAILVRWPGLEVSRVRVQTIENVLRGAGHRRDLAKKAAAVKELAGRLRTSSSERSMIGLEMRIHAELVQTFLKQTKDLEVLIKVKVDNHPIGAKLLAMPGVAHLTAGALVGEALPVARIVDEGKLATYAGLTPLSRKSCTIGHRSRLAKGVNKFLAHAHFMSAEGSLNASAMDRRYYDQQRELHVGHPVPHRVAVISLARQRHKVMYKLMTTDAEYDKEILIRSHLNRQRQKKNKLH